MGLAEKRVTYIYICYTSLYKRTIFTLDTSSVYLTLSNKRRPVRMYLLFRIPPGRGNSTLTHQCELKPVFALLLEAKAANGFGDYSKIQRVILVV